METQIGRTKSGDLLRIYKDKNTNENYKLEVGGETKNSFDNREQAIREGKVFMLKTWLPGAKEEDIKNMLKSFIKIEYDFMLEWCDRMANEDIECDCGCWGYPMEIGTYWTWEANKYKGCSKCSEKIVEHKGCF